jgi:pimeloyl-ACP methyl ester carboxylesterase
MTNNANEAPAHGRSRHGIVYDRMGSGKPIVLVHGWCLNSAMWTYAQEALSASFEVITVDLPGFGRAAGLRGPYTIERYAEDLAALLDELGLKDASLVGFAFGAAVALESAARGNPRIASVVSVGIPTAASSPYEKMPKSMRRDWPDFARRSAQALFHTPQSEATLAWLERMFGGTALHVALATVNVLAAYEPLETVAKVRVPTLFLHAEHDLVAPVWLGEACVANAPAARLEVIKDCGHLMVLDQKTQFHEHVKNFVMSTQS